MTTNNIPAIHSGIGPATATPELLTTIGWAPETQRSGTSILIDHHFGTLTSTDGDVIVTTLADALVRYPWVQALVFDLITPEEDEVLRRAFESQREPLGTFTWVKDNAHVELPSQSFTIMTKPQERQFVHDITVIGKNATVRSIDVDRWGANMTVHSYDRTKIDENARVTSVSVAVSGLKQSVNNSHTEVAAGAAITDHTILFAPTGTRRDMTNTVSLTGPGAQAEQVARMVSDGGVIVNRSTLEAAIAEVRGFLECDGLMLQDTGQIESIPALDAKVARAQLSHEASVGMIDDDKMDYLMATGLDEDRARDLIVQGFLNLDDQQVPASVRATVDNLVTAARGAEKM